MESFLGASPPAWNEGLEAAGAKHVKRSTSLKRRPASQTQVDEDSWDEEDGEIEDIPDSNFEVLDTSLPGKLDGECAFFKPLHLGGGVG